MATPTYLWHSGEVMVYLQPKQQFLNVVAKEREMTSGTNKHFLKMLDYTRNGFRLLSYILPILHL